MNQLQFFSNEQFGPVRTVMVDGEPWFVAKDVCDALEIQNVTQALERLDNDERSMFNIGRQGETNVINEPGLYTLILGSRKPEARAFKRWITHEVLPALRRTGEYSIGHGRITAALEELHCAMDIMQDMLADMKETLPPRSSLERAIAAKEEGTLSPQHFGSCSKARQLLDRNEIVDRITVYLVNEDCTVSELAEALGVDKRSVFRWRSGENAPTGERLARFCEIIGCNLSDLLR